MMLVCEEVKLRVPFEAQVSSRHASADLTSKKHIK